MSNSFQWPGPHNGDRYTHSIVLLNLPTPKPILFHHHSSQVEVPLAEALENHFRKAKSPTQPLKREKSRTGSQLSASKVINLGEVVLPTGICCQCPGTTSPCSAIRRLMVSHLHSSYVTNQMHLLK